jgi:hypothetical protein
LSDFANSACLMRNSGRSHVEDGGSGPVVPP